MKQARFFHYLKGRKRLYGCTTILFGTITIMSVSAAVALLPKQWGSAIAIFLWGAMCFFIGGLVFMSYLDIQEAMEEVDFIVKKFHLHEATRIKLADNISINMLDENYMFSNIYREFPADKEFSICLLDHSKDESKLIVCIGNTSGRYLYYTIDVINYGELLDLEWFLSDNEIRA